MKNEAALQAVQSAAWHYLWEKADPRTGLVPDHVDCDGIVVSPASIGPTGMALSALPIAVNNGFVSRREGAQRALVTLRFFAHTAQQHGGFFFHFLDMETGQRVWQSEVSSVDSSFLFLGALFCRAFFTEDTPQEREIRDLCCQIVERADWNWFCAGQDGVSIAYTPERGFSKHIWRGYNEALPVYILGLGSKTHQLSSDSYESWLRDYRLKRVYGIEYLYDRPLFTHLFPHMWLDLREIRDQWMRDHDLSYFENTRRAIAIQIQWAKRRGHEEKWGVSACDGPNTRKNGGYQARGVPFGKFDGVFSPPVCIASHPFEPEIANAAWEFWLNRQPELLGKWGVRGAFQPQTGWMSGYFGLDQAMLVLMIENSRTGLMWELSREIPELQQGLKRAGFR